jgi:hypothetical protein
MKFLIILFLALGAIAAAIVAPEQPTSPGTHIIAPAGYDGTYTSETLLLSTEGEPIHPAPVPGTSNNDIAIPTGTDMQLPATPTTRKAAKVTQLSRPHDPEPIIILPFHFQVIENCMSDHSIAARGVYVNRDYVWAYNFPSGATNVVKHNVDGYPYTFLVGPFDYASSTLHFSYDNGPWKCDWNDQETWKECGECRSGLWNADKLDCGNAGGMKTRSKDMDCSFIMGCGGVSLRVLRYQTYHRVLSDGGIFRSLQS